MLVFFFLSLSLALFVFVCVCGSVCVCVCDLSIFLSSHICNIPIWTESFYQHNYLSILISFSPVVVPVPFCARSFSLNQKSSLTFFAALHTYAHADIKGLGLLNYSFYSEKKRGRLFPLLTSSKDPENVTTMLQV